MTYIFSEAGLAALRCFIDHSILFAFDLDGTLAPIVPDPSTIHISEEVRAGFSRLSNLAITAIITGRSRDDALNYLEFEPHYLVGNHGAEGLPGKKNNNTAEMFRLAADWERQLGHMLPPTDHSGIVIENKGTTVSMHYRHAMNTALTHDAVLTAIARLTPAPRRVGGKFVENLTHQGAPDKGDALLNLMSHSGCPKGFFLGDDETDEDIFRLKDERIFAVHVGMEEPTMARYALRNQDETARLIDEIADILTNRAQDLTGCGN